MTPQNIAFQELIIMGGIGFCLIIAGIIICEIVNRKNAKCSAIATGKVIDYYYVPAQSDTVRIGPIVEFENENGKKYTAKMKFAGYISTSSSRRKGLDNVMWEDSKNVLHIVTGRKGLSEYAMAQNLWPVGSEMPVYYDPDDPMKHNYVKRPIKSSIMAKIFNIGGIFLIIVAIIMHFVILKG